MNQPTRDAGVNKEAPMVGRVRAVALVAAMMVGATGCGESAESDADDAPDAVTDEEAWVVDFDRYGPIPLGVPFDTAQAAAAGGLDTPASFDECIISGFSDRDEMVWFMVVDGEVVLVDVHDPDVATLAGARIGDTEARIRSLYPESLEVRPHRYTEGNYLIASPNRGGPFRIVFETDGMVVQNYRAGTLPAVEWVEGCS